MVLRKMGYSIHEVYSLDDGRNLADAVPFDLVLLCHAIPMEEQLKLIGGFYEGQSLIPILCITAYDGARQKECINVENSPVPLLEAIDLAVIGVKRYPKSA